MMIDYSLFFKLYVDYDKIMIVSGYDFINNAYILKRYNVNKDFFWNEYRELKEETIKKLMTAEEAIKLENEKVNSLKEILTLYERFASNCRTYEAKNTIRRLVDTRKYINTLTDYLTNFKRLTENDRNLYERELIKAKKGERRVLKVLYSRLSPEDYTKLLECINTYPEFNIFDIKKKIERHNKIITQLEEISKLKIKECSN